MEIKRPRDVRAGKQLEWAKGTRVTGAKGFVFLSGITGRDPKTGELVKGGIDAQMDTFFSYVDAKLKELGTSMENICHIRMDWRVTDFLTRFQYRKADERIGYDERRRIIEDAMKRGMDLEILYLKPDDTKSRRTVRPLSIELMEFKGKSFEGLRAYCCLRKSERSFRIDRILEIAYSVGSN